MAPVPWAVRLRDRLPVGSSLTPEVFDRRHRALRYLVLLHVPALALIAGVRGVPLTTQAVAVVPLVAAFLGSTRGSRQVRATVNAAAFTWCSVMAVWLTGGSVQGHFHVFVALAFVALYEDWSPFLVCLAGSLLALGVGSALAPDRVYDHRSGQAHPWVWAAVHTAFVLVEAVALAIYWRATEQEQRRTTALAGVLTAQDLARTQEESEQQQAATELLTSLARRNQGLLDRQLGTIDRLEQTERDPGTLAELFTLDHLATRMRRNAESLLVLSGEEGPQGWHDPVPLSEVVRGAVAEIEDYTRADVALVQDATVQARVVGDLVHLLAELVENATSFSPPTTRVLVGGALAPGGYVVTVTDQGIGMSDAELAAANDMLAAPAPDALALTGMLGFHVVARLAARSGTRVWLSRGEVAGLIAYVSLPADVLVDTAALPAPVPQEVVVTAAAPAVPVPVPGVHQPLVHQPVVHQPVVHQPVVQQPVVSAPQPVAALPVPPTPAVMMPGAPLTAAPAAALSPLDPATPLSALPPVPASLLAPLPAAGPGHAEPAPLPPAPSSPMPPMPAVHVPAQPQAGQPHGLPLVAQASPPPLPVAPLPVAPVPVAPVPVAPLPVAPLPVAPVPVAPVPVAPLPVAPLPVAPLPPAPPVPAAAEPAAPVPAAPPVVPVAPSAPAQHVAPLTAAGLRRRVPSASLAAPLAAGQGGAPAVAARVAEPERARSVLAAYTSGLQRGRVESDTWSGDPRPVAGAESAASEEAARDEL